MEERQKDHESVGSGGFLRPPVGSRGIAPVGIRGPKPPEAENFIQLKGMKTPLFLTLYPVSNSHLQNTLYCALWFSSRVTNQASTKISIQKLYTHNISNKGCTHNRLSFWSYVLVYVGRSNCQQLMSASTRGKQVWLS